MYTMPANLILSLSHPQRYGDETQVSVTGRRAGTEAVRVAVVHMKICGRFTGLLCINASTSRVGAGREGCLLLLPGGSLPPVPIPLGPHRIQPPPSPFPFTEDNLCKLRLL